MTRKRLEIENRIYAPLQKVWKYWTRPEHIKNWNHANSDWHTPNVKNDLRKNGRFSFRMEAKDGSVGFNMEGVYEEIEEKRLISYKMTDGRRVVVKFKQEEFCTRVKETFEAEEVNSARAQLAGWKAILDNFKSYVEQE